jgi:hypothetical protein
MKLHEQTLAPVSEKISDPDTPGSFQLNGIPITREALEKNNITRIIDKTVNIDTPICYC